MTIHHHLNPPPRSGSNPTGFRPQTMGRPSNHPDWAYRSSSDSKTPKRIHKALILKSFILSTLATLAFGFASPILAGNDHLTKEEALSLKSSRASILAQLKRTAQPSQRFKTMVMNKANQAEATGNLRLAALYRVLLETKEGGS